MYQSDDKTNKGFVALTAVMVCGALLFGYVLVVLYTDFSLFRSVGLYDDSTTADIILDSCIEVALDRIWEDDTVGYGTLTLSGNQCGYLITNSGGQSRVITASSTVGVVTSNATVNLSAVSPVIEISSWQYN